MRAWGKALDAVTIKVVSIDEYMKDKEPATFIKMDIEGGEYDAISGAKNTIIKEKPKLALSVYHKATDLWKIPLSIKKLKPDYKMYIRHYSREIIDTVCFAI